MQEPSFRGGARLAEPGVLPWAAQLERIDKLAKQTGQIIPFLFPHRSRRRHGQRRMDYREACLSVCREAGVPGMLRHDCRRTAVRNIVNARVPEGVAMTVTGHRTRAVFDRTFRTWRADSRAQFRAQ